MSRLNAINRSLYLLAAKPTTEDFTTYDYRLFRDKDSISCKIQFVESVNFDKNIITWPQTTRTNFEETLHSVRGYVRKLAWVLFRNTTHAFVLFSVLFYSSKHSSPLPSVHYYLATGWYCTVFKGEREFPSDDQGYLIQRFRRPHWLSSLGQLLPSKRQEWTFRAS